GPKYQYPPSLFPVHLTAQGYRRLGIKYAQVFHRVVIEGLPWAPLQPTGVTRDGREITVVFHVPHPPLNWDPEIKTPHGPGTNHPAWADGRGFEVADSTGDLSIEGVRIEA